MARAQETLATLRENHYSEQDGLSRIPERDGHRGIRARGFDYATLLRALFDVYRHDLDPAHLVWAEALAKEALAQLRDADGLLAETSEEEQFAGHAVYSGLMVFGESTWGTIYGPLARLFRLTGNPEFGQTASAIRARLAPLLDLSVVRLLADWLRHSYGEAIADPSSLRSAFVTNRAYAGLKAPVREVAPGCFVPDFGARYLAEDVPFGLAVSRAIAAMAGVETPTVDRVIAWASERLGKDYLGRDANLARIPQNYGLDSLERLISFTNERLGIGD